MTQRRPDQECAAIRQTKGPGRATRGANPATARRWPALVQDWSASGCHERSPGVVEAKIDSEPPGDHFYCAVLLGLRGIRRWQGSRKQLARHFDRLIVGCDARPEPPHRTCRQHQQHQAENDRQIELVIQSFHDAQFSRDRSFSPAPWQRRSRRRARSRTRRGFLGSSSIAARIREICTSMDRSKASSACPFSRSISLSRDRTRPACSARASNRSNW